MAEKATALGEEPFYTAVKRIILQTIDLYWVDHLEMMDYLRSSVNLRAYGQRDPLVEYKREGLRLFKEMEGAIVEQILRVIPHVAAAAFTKETAALRGVEKQAVEVGGARGTTDAGLSGGAPHANPKKEVGRNDPCWCGSGKKFKKCGDLNTEEHQKLIAKK